MRYLKMKWLALVVMSLGLSLVVAEVQAEEIEEGYYVQMMPRGFGKFFDRSNGFRIGSTGNWGNLVLTGGPGDEQAIAFDTDHWGGGYGLVLLLGNEDRFQIEASLEQAYLSTEENAVGLPGTGAGNVTNMAFIDGEPRGTSTNRGFFVSAHPTPGSKALGLIKVKQFLNTHSLSLRAVYKLLNKKTFSIDLFGGPAYSGYFQDFRVLTSGTNGTSGAHATSKTIEELNDHLVGGEFGLRGKWRVVKGLFVAFKQGFGFFARFSRLEAAQTVVNVSGNAGGGVLFTSLNDGITLREREIETVPQYESEVSLGYDVTDWLSFQFYYGFEALFNMSRVENPVITANQRHLLNGPTRLDRENLYAHEIGGKIAIKF